MKHKLVLKEIFADIVGGCPRELNPFLECSLCGTPFYIINASWMDWSNNDNLPGNTIIEMDMHCECPDPKPLPDTEKGWYISFDIGQIVIGEVRTRFIKTKPYRTHLERRKVIAKAEVKDWDRIRQKISDFLLLPVGFE